MGNANREMQEREISMLMKRKKMEGQTQNSPVLTMLWKLLMILWCMVQKVCSPKAHNRGVRNIWERGNVNSRAEVCS